MDPYAQLVALAEREATLVAAEAWDDLGALAAERAAAVAALPPAPPPEARPLLEQLAGMQQLASAALGAARAETARELRQLGHGRGAVRGYAATAADGAAPWAVGGRTA